MKNLSTICLATLAFFAGASLLYSQATSSQGGYSAPQGLSTSQGGVSNPNMMAYPNNTGYQPDMNASGQNFRGNQTSPDMQNSNRWSSDQNKINNPNQPYTQPSNVPNGMKRGNDFLSLKDADISQSIRWAIRDDKFLSPLAKSSEVTVKNSNVTLTGSVNNEDEKTRIGTIVRRTVGVKGISNNLQINTR